MMLPCWMILGTATAAPALPTEPVLNPTTAAAAPAGTVLVGAGLAGGWTGAPRGGLTATARWWPTRRLLASAELGQGVAELGCVGCSGVLGRVSVRGNIVEQDFLRVGAYAAAEASPLPHPTGAASAGVAAEGGTDRVRLALAAPLVSTVDLLEDARTGWESGLTVHSWPGHATRIGTVGPRFRPLLAHRYATERWWTGGELVLAEPGPVLRLRAGLLF